MLISLSAAVMAGMLVYAVYRLQLRQIDLQETVEVVVPVSFVPAGQRLSADMLALRPIARASFRQGMLTDKSAAVGMETAVPLGGEEPILDWKIDRFRLLPLSGQSTFQIPREYVRSVSSGIRAGDFVDLFVSGEGSPSVRLFDEPVTVASVKTSGNQEIDDPKNSNLLSMAHGDMERMYASRRDANGMIDAVNLNLTEAQWLKIDMLCKTGASRLVIAFNPQSLNGGSGAASGDGPYER